MVASDKLKQSTTALKQREHENAERQSNKRHKQFRSKSIFLFKQVTVGGT